MDQHLLCLFDYRPITPSDMPLGTAPKPETGDDIDGKVDLVRQIGIKLGKSLLVDFCVTAGSLQRTERFDAAFVLIVQIFQDLLSFSFFLEHPLAGDLRNVGLFQVNCARETILQACKLDLLGVECAHDLVQLLLRGDNNPAGSRCFPSFYAVLAFAPESLYYSLEVEHLLHTAGNILPYFIDDENQGMSRLAFGCKLKGAFR